MRTHGVKVTAMNRMNKTLSATLSATLSTALSATLLAACASGGASAGGAATASGGASATEIVLDDPTGGDNGPGSYTYPTDKVYAPGSFDIKKLEVVPQGDTVEFRLTLNARSEDPWDSKAWGGNGFSVQMAFIHLDTDKAPGSGVQVGLAGTNVRFAPEQAWDRVVILSPQGPTRVNSEIEQKAAEWKDKIVVPKVTRASGRTLIAVVDARRMECLATLETPQVIPFGFHAAFTFLHASIHAAVRCGPSTPLMSGGPRPSSRTRAARRSGRVPAQ